MSARPMTVLQVIPSLDTGGAERTTLDIAAALTAAGDRAIVASAGGRMVEALEATGARHVRMPVATKRVVGLLRNAAALADLMETEGVDIVHARSRAPAWSALWAASWTYRPLVTTYHGVYAEQSFLKNRYNSVMARGDAVIANSVYVAALVAERHPFARRRIVTIHRGIDVEAFDAVPDDRIAAIRASWSVGRQERVILHAARLTAWKGQELLLEALHGLPRDPASPWVAVIGGDDQGRSDYRERLAAKVRALGLEDRVRVTGHIADVPAALGASTLAVQPSTEPEAFGRAAVEAQAAGVPVIVSGHGAVRETVLAPPDVSDDKRTGWHVAPGDAAALASAIEEALAAPPERLIEMGQRGRAHARQHFSLAAMQRKTLAVYHSLLEDEDSALY